jgi:predicted metal-dependent phosphoesterase TrpH
MPRRFVDLHTHSLASDGQLPPAEIVRLAEAAQLAAVALTDHDTVDGLAAAEFVARQYSELKFVPGIETSARFQAGTMHILGLGIDAKSPALGRICEELRAARRERNPRMIARLQELGFDIDMEYVLATAGEMEQSAVTSRDAQASGALSGVAKPADKQVLGRLHMAHAMRRKGYVSSTQEAFEKYLGDGKPAYVDKERLEPKALIAAILDAGGVAALAHPPQLHYENRAQFERILRDLIGQGLNGLEVYHADHSVDQTRLYLDFALRFGLAVTGGSDYHGPDKPQSRIGYPRVPLAGVGEETIVRLAR